MWESQLNTLGGSPPVVFCVEWFEALAFRFLHTRFLLRVEYSHTSLW